MDPSPLMRLHSRFVQVLLVSLLTLAAYNLAAQGLPWIPVGPAGGDARAFSAVPGQPNHLYMGTTNSWLYESLDRGATWRRLSKLDISDDLILDHIVVDLANPRILYVAAWAVDRPGGGFWISRDAGHTWTQSEGLRGQSVRAFVRAPSDPHLFFAGTLAGVFRSPDGGASWSLISPSGNAEIHEVESLAVDPVDPNIIYAGTWHLPWKTTDGGKTWNSIKQGLIDDSDVFSIIIDPVTPTTAFLSACSGIYKTDNAAALFHKIQGIPSSARRTRVLKQDPVNRDIVYAGTTEGLYKTLDGGKTFQRTTGPDVIVNDVFIDPRDTQHVLLATDRSGVLLSHDAGLSFVPANQGFSGRKVEALLVDNRNSSWLYAGVVNDKTYGGVFASKDGGDSWEQLADGLEGRDVFALAQAPDGTILAGTNRGLFALQPDKLAPQVLHWAPRNTIQNFLVKKSFVLKKGKRVPLETRVKVKPSQILGRVWALDLSADAWLASTTNGLLTSRDQGVTWQGNLVMGSGEFLTVAAHGATMAAASRDALVVSTDAGQSWTATTLPSTITRLDRAVFSPDGTLWLGGREGVNLSRDLGKTWQWIERLPFRDVNDLYFDTARGKVLVSSRQSDLVYVIDPVDLKWKWTRAGWKVFLIRAAAGHLLGASFYDGVLVEPHTQTTTAQTTAAQR